MEVLDIKRLIECREKLGITKQEAAKRVQVSQPAYLRYEAGTRNPSIQVIMKMAEVFSTSADYLVGKTEEAESNRIVIEYNDMPKLYKLVDTCKAFNDAQLERMIMYAKSISNMADFKHKSLEQRIEENGKPFISYGEYDFGEPVDGEHQW